MRGTPWLILATLVLVGHIGLAPGLAQTGAKPVNEAFLLERGRAGQFEVGQAVVETYKRAGPKRVRLAASFVEGMFEPELEIRLAGFTKGPALIAGISESPCIYYELTGMTVYDPRFRTRNGLGVGSTLGQIKRLYASAEVFGIDTDSGPIVRIDELGLTFAFNSARSFPDTARVTSVWVTPLSEEVLAQRRPCTAK